jgi:hypothetical protein
MTYQEALEQADKRNTNLRRKIWPDNTFLTKIWSSYSLISSNIKLQTHSGAERWNPTRYDLTATDWEIT